MKSTILQQFDDQSAQFDLLGKKLKSILSDLLLSNQIDIHHISTRTKTKESLSKKIDSKENKYNNIVEVTDICGIRIITYLDSDVDKVADLIATEFNVDQGNSIDKRKLQSDQFGYKSLHYVISFDDSRLKVSEYKKFKGYKAEIQIRTILQHAWAEIEHDLGYKGVISVPEHFKRSFNRLSALLETADVEFDRLKKDLSKYKIEVKKIIANTPNIVTLDKTSLSFFVESNPILSQAKGIIKNIANCKFTETSDWSWQSTIVSLRFQNIHNIGELENLLNEYKQHFLQFITNFITKTNPASIGSHVALFYFQYFYAASRNDKNYFESYLRVAKISLGGKITAIEFIKMYNESKPK